MQNGYGVWPQITTGFLNTVNDADIASRVAGAIRSRFAGQLGKRFTITSEEALSLSSTLALRLFEGTYQYVKFVTAVARGEICAWSLNGATVPGIKNYEVTDTIAIATEGSVAGIALGTVTAGNYGFIQTQGLASVQFRASVTSTVDGSLVLQLTTTNTADAIADATGSYISGGALGLKNIIGRCQGAPANGAISLVNLFGIPQVY